MNSHTKILFIGIDSADKDLILNWTNQGLLPTFQTLLETAAWGTTSTPVGFYVGSLWPSFATGVSAARHKRYCFSQLSPESYQTYRFNIFDLKGERFWDTLSRAGRQVAVIDVPLTPPSENLNGIQITDWGVHKSNDKDVFYTWPPSLASEIESEFGRDPIRRCNDIERTVEGFKDFKEKMLARTIKKEKLSSKFLAEGNWDLFLTVFTEPHCVGHQCWHIHDVNNPNYKPELARLLGDPLLEQYKSLDASMGRLIAEAGPETLVFVYSSHGMGSQDGVGSFLERILLRLEGSELDSNPVFKKIQDYLNYLGKPKLLMQKLLKPDFAVASLRVGHRKCFVISNNDACGAIRVNLVGREPQGKIHPGEEYDKLCKHLTQDLLEIVDDQTGKPIVKQVLRTPDHYQGPYLNDLPDLIVEWNRTSFIPSVSSPKIGRLQNTYSGVRTGDHKPEGIFFISGPGIKPGKLDQQVSVLDFAPTIAHLLDVSLPYAEGEVLHCVSEINLSDAVSQM